MHTHIESATSSSPPVNNFVRHITVEGIQDLESSFENCLFYSNLLSKMGLTADVGTDYFTGFKQLKLFNIRMFTNLQVGHQGFEEAANGGGAGPNPGQWGHDPFSIFQDVSTLHTLSIAVLLVL